MNRSASRLFILFTLLFIVIQSIRAETWIPKIQGNPLRLGFTPGDNPKLAVGPDVEGNIIYVQYKSGSEKWMVLGRTINSKEQIMLIKNYINTHELDPRPPKHSHKPEDFLPQALQAIAQDNPAALALVINAAFNKLGVLDFFDFLSTHAKGRNLLLLTVLSNPKLTNTKTLMECIASAAHRYLTNDKEYGDLEAYFIQTLSIDISVILSFNAIAHEDDEHLSEIIQKTSDAMDAEYTTFFLTSSEDEEDTPDNNGTLLEAITPQKFPKSFALIKTITHEKQIDVSSLKK